MNAILTIAAKEIRDGIRNRWVVGAIVLLTVLSVSLLMMGSAPAGSLKANSLEVTVVSLSSLTVYLLPLIALTLSFDAFVGEIERGTMLLLLSYPVKRWQIVIGKFIGHLTILAVAIVIGYGVTGAFIGIQDGAGKAGITAYVGMMGSSLILGAVFIGLGFMISVVARERSTAVAFSIGVWLCFVVLYDLVLLGIIVNDQNHFLDQQLFSFLMLASPTDTYRMFNLSGTRALEAITGLASIGQGAMMERSTLITIMLGWTVVPLLAAGFLFQRKEL